MKAAPPPTAPDFLETACSLASQLTPEARATIEKAWPADRPPAAVVAHMLAVMLTDTDRHVSRGFIRMPLDRAMETPGPGAGLRGEAQLRQQAASAADSKPKPSAT